MAHDDATNTVVMFGGTNAMPTDQTWTWDGSTWTQLHPRHSPSARQGATMAYDPTHKVVLLFGGVGYTIGDASKTFLNGGSDRQTLDTDTWAWDGHDWSNLDQGKGFRGAEADPAMAWDGHDGTMVLDEICPSECYMHNSRTFVWSWLSHSWTMAPGPGPIPWDEAGQNDTQPPLIMDASLTFVPSRQGGTTRAVGSDPGTGGIMFVSRGQEPDLGGRETSAPVDHHQVETWSWLDSGWHGLRPAGFPTGNSLPTPQLARTGSGNQMLLFDGWGETWLWDGSTWTKGDGATSPGRRGGFAMVYDPEAHGVVLFGGESAAGGILADTWVWANGRWNHSAGPANTALSPFALPYQPDPQASLGADNCRSLKTSHVGLSGGSTHIAARILTRRRDIPVDSPAISWPRWSRGIETQPGRLVCIVVVACDSGTPCLYPSIRPGIACGTVDHCPSLTPAVPQFSWYIAVGDPLQAGAAADGVANKGPLPSSITGIPNLLK